jgi:ubiquinone/menaquinone biosynthesis C-methylase UbiE
MTAFYEFINNGGGGRMSTEEFKNKVKRNVADHFDQSFQIYQAFEEKHRFFAGLALKLAESIGLQERSSVLDVGCGNGISARALNERFGCRVLGVDLSEQMIAAGQVNCTSPAIRLIRGDGEKLSRIVGDQRFDYVLYNASIFIFPDVAATLDESFKCLRPGGKIAFSFYPQLLGEDDEDLLTVAFERLGEPQPKFRVITDYDKARQALADRCGNICHHQWEQPLDTAFLQDFFSIPAQSASLFPGRDYEARRDRVGRLFAGLEDMMEKGRIVWRMAEGGKSETSD